MAIKLLSLGADLEARDGEGLTAFALADHYQAFATKYAMESWIERQERK
jgi:hypothetical protein